MIKFSDINSGYYPTIDVISSKNTSFYGDDSSYLSDLSTWNSQMIKVRVSKKKGTYIGKLGDKENHKFINYRLPCMEITDIPRAMGFKRPSVMMCSELYSPDTHRYFIGLWNLIYPNLSCVVETRFIPFRSITSIHKIEEIFFGPLIKPRTMFFLARNIDDGETLTLFQKHPSFKKIIKSYFGRIPESFNKHVVSTVKALNTALDHHAAYQMNYNGGSNVVIDKHTLNRH